MGGTSGSIPAAEHSTITSWGREHERDAYENMLAKFGSGGLVAVVSDSYDIYNAVSNIWGDQLRTQVEDMAAMLVIRPDSGDPTTVPVEVMRRLDERFGSVVNSKGFRVLNHVRVIQGDGVNLESIRALMHNVMAAGYSISNIAFGMGGALLQLVGRDDLGFAMKCSAVRVNGEWRSVFKDPVTDPGKRSKSGRLALVRKDGVLETVAEDMLFTHLDPRCNLLETVFQNGMVISRPKWKDVVARARSL
jgi:nicotinamide phosphoribosyltransferase